MRRRRPSAGFPRHTGLRPSTLRVPKPSPSDQRRPTHRWLIRPEWPSGGSRDAPEFLTCFRVIARQLSCQLNNQPVRTQLAFCSFVSARGDDFAAMYGPNYPSLIEGATISIQHEQLQGLP